MIDIKKAFFAQISVFILLLIGVFLTSCVSLSSVNPLALSVKKGRPFEIMSTAKAYGWGVISHPFIGPLRMDEPVYVRYNLAGDHGGKEGALKETRGLGPAISFDHGKTFVYGNSRLPEDFSYLRLLGRIETTNGLFCFSGSRNMKGGWVTNGTLKVQSKIPTHVSFGVHSGPDYRFMNRGIERSDGALLIPAMAIAQRGPNKGDWTAFTMISTNKGSSFHDYSVIATKKDVPTGVLCGPNESDMIRCENGDLICIMRTGMTRQWGANPVTDMGSMLIARSGDEGETWKVKQLGLPGVNPHMIRLQNGVLVLAYGRPGNNLAFSLDDGYTWGHELHLTSADIKSSGYVAITEVAPNRMLVVYDMHDTDKNGIWLWEPKEVNGVFGCFVEVMRRRGKRDDGGEFAKVERGLLNVECEERSVDGGDRRPEGNEEGAELENGTIDMRF